MEMHVGLPCMLVLSEGVTLPCPAPPGWPAGLIPMPAALLGALWLLNDVSGAYDGQGHIAHAGHLGGAAVGLAFFLLFKRGVIRPRGWY